MNVFKRLQRAYMILFLIGIITWATFLQYYYEGYFREIHDPTLLKVIVFSIYINVSGLIISFCFGYQLEKHANNF